MITFVSRTRTAPLDRSAKAWLLGAVLLAITTAGLKETRAADGNTPPPALGTLQTNQPLVVYLGRSVVLKDVAAPIIIVADTQVVSYTILGDAASNGQVVLTGKQAGWGDVIISAKRGDEITTIVQPIEVRGYYYPCYNCSRWRWSRR